MPTPGTFQSHYQWDIGSTGGGGGGGGGGLTQYPQWQAVHPTMTLSMVTPLGLLVLLWQHVWHMLCRWWCKHRIVRGLDDTQLDQLGYAADLLRQPPREAELDVAASPPETIEPETAVVLPAEPDPALWEAMQMTRDLDRPQVQVLVRLSDYLRHPGYPIARRAVRETAQVLGFNRGDNPERLATHRRLKQDAAEMENMHRHMRTVFTIRSESPSTVAHPVAHALAELAYQEFALIGR